MVYSSDSPEEIAFCTHNIILSSLLVLLYVGEKNIFSTLKLLKRTEN